MEDILETSDAPDVEQPVLPPEEFVRFVTSSQNLVPELSDEKLTEIGNQVLEDYDMDKASMADWFEKMKHGLDLAKLVKGGEKDYPFKGASDIKYPMITEAALQFNARAYPAVVPSDQVVKCTTYGSDPQGLKAARGERIASHMSWQLTGPLEEWEEETDRLLLQLPIVGEMFRKWWIDPVERRSRCRLIEAGKLIVNDKVKTLADAPRCSEELPLYPVEIQSRIRSKQFVEFEWDEQDDKQAPEEFVEQHTRLDLDDDGYEEPYIVTVHVERKKVVRIVADFTPENVRYQTETQMRVTQKPVGQDAMGNIIAMDVPEQVEVPTGILSIQRGSYFVAHQFWPSMDGGFHGTGLGLLLGDISEAINTSFNMLIDAGHYASLGGGFIGSDFRVKGGAQRHRPGEYKLASATGSAIKDSIVPLTFPGPNETLFAMLGMLIEAGKGISSTKDIMTGDTGGKNMQPTTLAIMVDQGMKLFSAVYKRVYRSMKKEYKLLAKMNRETVSPEEYNAFHDDVDQQGQPIQYDPAKEYDLADMDIMPVADPSSVTKTQEAVKAQMLIEMSAQGMVNPAAAAMRILDAFEIPDIEELLPQPDPMQQQMMMMQVQAAQAQLVQAKVDIDLTLAKIQSEQAKAATMVAGEERQQAEHNLKVLQTVLEDERGRLDAAIKAGSLVGRPGNGGNSGSSSSENQNPSSRGPINVLVGAPGGSGQNAAASLRLGGNV